MKTYRFLTAESVSAEQVRGRFRKHPNEDLLRALHNPDHSASAVTALRSVLRERGVTEDQISAFRTEPEELQVVPLNTQPSIETALRRPKRWQWLNRGMLIGALVSLVAGILFLHRDEQTNQGRVDQLIATGAISGVAYQREKDNVWDVAKLNEAILQANGVPQASSGAVVIVFVLFLLPGIRAAFWIWPARILLLRPFNTQQVSKSLKRFIRRNVVGAGHVFTLADQHLQESFLYHLWETLPKSPEELLLRILFLFRLYDDPRRRLFIKKASHYCVLKRRLSSRFLLNTFWTASIDKIRKVRTTDAWWQRCVDLLCANCELILIDLSVVKSGTHWELAKVSREKLEHKAIFIVHVNRVESARSVLADYWPGGELPHIFSYNDKGVVETKEDFARHVASVMALPRPAYHGKPKVHFLYLITLISCFLPFIGMISSALLSNAARRSAGRLRGRRLARVALPVSVMFTGFFVWLAVSSVKSGGPDGERSRSQSADRISAEEAPQSAVNAINRVEWKGFNFDLPVSWKALQDDDGTIRLFEVDGKYICAFEVSPHLTEGEANPAEANALQMVEGFKRLFAEVKVLDSKAPQATPFPSWDMRLHVVNEGATLTMWMRTSIVGQQLLHVRTLIEQEGLDSAEFLAVFNTANDCWQPVNTVAP